jgi:hypothetical protein
MLLPDRISQGPIPLDEAHEAGIHSDLILGNDKVPDAWAGYLLPTGQLWYES